MLIGCITGPDFETAKSQIKVANELCDGIELRQDLLESDSSTLKKLATGEVICTDKEIMVAKEMTFSCYHNYEETPADLNAILNQMPKADLYKLSTMANSTIDSLRMLEFVRDHPNVAGMCMGSLGQITRILGPIFGSALTFAAIGNPAAPGQLQLDELLHVYRYRDLNVKTEIFGLIGNPITHSPSHQTHNRYFKKHKCNAIYVKMELQEEELPLFFPLIKSLNFKGLSVTMPFKEKLFDYVDHIEDEAKIIGAINTLTFEEKVYGSNTDAKGGIDALGIEKMEGKRCCILGAGGAAKALAYEAQKRGAIVSIHSRKLGNMEQLPPYDILINATSHPCPIDLSQLQPKTTVMDIAIQHKSSPLMQRATLLECCVIDGRKMFDLQALRQFARWGKKPLI